MDTWDTGAGGPPEKPWRPGSSLHSLDHHLFTCCWGARSESVPAVDTLATWMSAKKGDKGEFPCGGEHLCA